MYPTAVDLAEAAMHVYTEHTVDRGSSEAMIVTRQAYSLIAVRGSEHGGSAKAWDIARNLQFWPWRTAATGWAHAGFLRGARRLVDPCVEAIPQDRPVYICGHSKGGAEALLLGALLASIGYDIVSISTYGAPKASIGSGVENALAGAHVFRYVNGHDIVPSLPPAVFGVHHVGLLIELTGGLGPLADHAMSGYLEGITT
jgi:predicted lipase